MTSMALDLTTIAHALLSLADEGVGAHGWQATNKEQQEFLDWYAAHRDEVGQLTGLTAKASTDYRVLNDTLQQRNFAPQFDDTLTGIGVVSILDMLVEWLEECQTTTIRWYNQPDSALETYPAFTVTDGGAMVYEVEKYPFPLVELKTKSGHSLWLIEALAPLSGFELVRWSQHFPTVPRKAHTTYRGGATVPMLDMSLQPDLRWLKRMQVVDDDWFIAQAAQEFKLRANEKGARVKAATSLFVTRGVSRTPQPYVIRHPFFGWFTQPGHESLPLATFWADTDVWRSPEGTLEEL